MNVGNVTAGSMSVDGRVPNRDLAPADMTAEQLCARYDALGREYREALRENRPAEAVLALENDLRRVGNQLRKRGL